MNSKTLLSIENFKLLEQNVANVIYQRNGQEALSEIPVKIVRQVIYENLQGAKQFYDQNGLQYETDDINQSVIQNSVEMLENEYVIEQGDDKNNKLLQQDPDQREVAERFERLRAERSQEYEQFIPFTNQQQGNPALDTRNFTDVRQNPPNEQQKQMLQTITADEQEQLRLKELTEQQFKERLSLMEQQEAEFYNLNNQAEQQQNPNSELVGSGGGLESLIKPPNPPKLSRTRKYISIFSGNRDVVAFPSRSSYTVSLSKELLNIKKVKVLKVVVPSEIQQKRYTDNTLENLRDFFQTNYFNYEHAILVHFKNINSENQNDGQQQQHTVATVFDRQQDQQRGRHFVVYTNASQEAIEYNGSVLDRLKQIEIEVRDQTGEYYKSNPQDDFKFNDLRDVVNVGWIIREGDIATVQTIGIQIALNKAFEVNYFYMGDYVRFTNVQFTIVGGSGTTYYYEQDGKLWKWSPIDINDLSKGDFKDYDGIGSLLEAEAGDYKVSELSQLMNFLTTISGHQIIGLQSMLKNVESLLTIALPATITGTEGSLSYQPDTVLSNIIKKYKSQGNLALSVTGSAINLSLQHTIIVEVECETPEIDNTQLQL